MGAVFGLGVSWRVIGKEEGGGSPLEEEDRPFIPTMAPVYLWRKVSPSPSTCSIDWLSPQRNCPPAAPIDPARRVVERCSIIFSPPARPNRDPAAPVSDGSVL